MASTMATTFSSTCESNYVPIYRGFGLGNDIRLRDANPFKKTCTKLHCQCTGGSVVVHEIVEMREKVKKLEDQVETLEQKLARVKDELWQDFMDYVEAKNRFDEMKTGG